MTLPLPSARSRIALWIVAAVLAGIAVGYELPAVASHHIAAPATQWVTSL